jgi:hypothetical protein
MESLPIFTNAFVSELLTCFEKSIIYIKNYLKEKVVEADFIDLTLQFNKICISLSKLINYQEINNDTWY